MGAHLSLGVQRGVLRARRSELGMHALEVGDRGPLNHRRVVQPPLMRARVPLWPLLLACTPTPPLCNCPSSM